jgi:hypothetical protein
MYKLHGVCPGAYLENSITDSGTVTSMVPCRDVLLYGNKVHSMGHNGNKKFIRQDNILLVFFIPGGLCPQLQYKMVARCVV